jgi:amino acid transporter
MAATGVDAPSSAMSGYIASGQEKETMQFDNEKHEEAGLGSRSESPSSAEGIASDLTHRQLRPRHIQLIGIGGTIGTALYVQIGRGLLQGGPASLFLAFTIWYVVIQGPQRREMG